MHTIPERGARIMHHREEPARPYRSTREVTVPRHVPGSWFIAAPPALILATLVIFKSATGLFGEQPGWYAGFAFYWLMAGFALPLLLVGRAAIRTSFAQPRVEWTWPLRLAVVLMMVPVLIGFLFVFPTLFPGANNLVLPGIAAYALVNGTAQEVFWRGCYMRRFPAHKSLGVLYPAVMFALWQLVPWMVAPSWFRLSVFAVLGAALLMGLLYNWVAWRTGSIRLTVLAHVLTNLSGIGALLLFGPP